MDDGSPTTAPGWDGEDEIVLVSPLRDRFTVVEVLRAGGHSNVMRCTRIGTGDEVVVKQFKRAVSAGGDPRREWRDLDPDHVASFVEPYLGRSDEWWWEVLEYCRFGTLHDYAQYHGGRMPRDSLRPVIAQLGFPAASHRATN